MHLGYWGQWASAPVHEDHHLVLNMETSCSPTLNSNSSCTRQANFVVVDLFMSPASRCITPDISVAAAAAAAAALQFVIC